MGPGRFGAMMAPLLRRWPGLTPQGRGLAVLYGLALVLVLVAGGLAVSVLALRELVALRLKPLEVSQTLLIEEVRSSLDRHLGDLQRLTRLLRYDPELLESLSREQPLDEVQLQRLFTQFSRVVPQASQIRWLDAQGRERVRVNVRAGQVEPVPPEKLQDKGHRNYFQEAMRAPLDAVSISSIDLNMERGKISLPLEPTLRTAMRTGEEGLRPGVLVINFDLTPLFASLRRLDFPSLHVELADDQGQWLLHPDRRLEWGLRAGSQGPRLSAQHPGLWQLIEAQPRRLAVRLGGELWSYARVFLGAREGGAGPLVIVARTEGQAVSRIFRRSLLEVGVVGGLLSALGLSLAWLLFRALWREQWLAERLEREKTELEEAYDELAEAHRQSQLLQEELVESRKLSSLGLMVAGVAHEINTPAGGALVSVSTLQAARDRLARQAEEGMTREDLALYLARSKEGLSLAQANLKRVVALVNSFKRLAIDRVDESPHTFSLAERVEDLVNFMGARIKRTPVALEYSVAEGLMLTSYPGILSQVLQNLVENALVHGIGEGREGGVLIEAKADKSPGWVRISVSDNGRGIDPEVRSRIFDPFVTTGRSQGSTGLGMHLVHQWVTQVLKGRVGVESPPGGGTRVWMQIPARLEDADQKPILASG